MNRKDTNCYYEGLTSEEANPNSVEIDEADTEEILRIINTEDMLVAVAVQSQISQIGKAVDAIYAAIKNGGRLIYIGAGTSGRLGVLDASECPPTFGTPPELVQAYIAGGDRALRYAVEGAEDDGEAGIEQMRVLHVTNRDIVVGITASGAAPFVLGALEEAKRRGADTVGVVTNKDTVLSAVAQITIAPVVGPEVVTGSTRMKSGTAQKLVLNMLTTAVMIKLGKVYKNMMVDLHASNQKLYQRAVRMVTWITGAPEETAKHALEKANGHVKLAAMLLKTGLSPEEAQKALDACEGHLGAALKG